MDLAPVLIDIVGNSTRRIGRIEPFEISPSRGKRSIRDRMKALCQIEQGQSRGSRLPEVAVDQDFLRGCPLIDEIQRSNKRFCTAPLVQMSWSINPVEGEELPIFIREVVGMISRRCIAPTHYLDVHSFRSVDHRPGFIDAHSTISSCANEYVRVGQLEHVTSFRGQLSLFPARTYVGVVSKLTSRELSADEDPIPERSSVRPGMPLPA